MHKEMTIADWPMPESRQFHFLCVQKTSPDSLCSVMSHTGELNLSFDSTFTTAQEMLKIKNLREFNLIYFTMLQIHLAMGSFLLFSFHWNSVYGG